MLTDRKIALEDDVRAQLREGRVAAPAPGRDDMERSDDNIRGDLDVALLQLKSESLSPRRAVTVERLVESGRIPRLSAALSRAARRSGASC